MQAKRWRILLLTFSSGLALTRRKARVLIELLKLLVELLVIDRRRCGVLGRFLAEGRHDCGRRMGTEMGGLLRQLSDRNTQIDVCLAETSGVWRVNCGY